MTTPADTAAAGLHLRPAAGRGPHLARQHRHAVDPRPGDYTRCLGWTYADLAGMVTRIANALTALGVRRTDAVTLSAPNTSMLYATTLAAQAVGIAAPVNPALSDEHLAGLIRRAQSRVVVTAGPELNEKLWQRMLQVARSAGVTAVLAIRPDGADGDPPVLTDLTAWPARA